MAIPLTLVKSTPHMLQYLADATLIDGADTGVLTSAILRGDVVAGPLKELLDAQFETGPSAPNTTVQSRRAIFGDAADVNRPHCKVDVTLRSGTKPQAIDAAADAVDATRIAITVSIAGAGGGSAVYITIHFQHSEER
jgi:hypothetical protein